MVELRMVAIACVDGATEGSCILIRRLADERTKNKQSKVSTVQTRRNKCFRVRYIDRPVLEQLVPVGTHDVVLDSSLERDSINGELAS
jgi:hypothetical protein